MKARQVERELLKEVPPGLLGMLTAPRNRKAVQYEHSKKKAGYILKGEETQNVFDVLQALSPFIKDSSIKPLTRYVLMSDNTRKHIFDLNEVLKKGRMESKCPSDPIPFIFHYDTTFNVGNNHVSILTMRDPTKKRITVCGKHTFHEAILPVAIMIHEGRLLEQHKAFFKTLDAQFLKGKVGDVAQSRKFILVSDHEFGDVWPSAHTIFCSNHMISNIKQKLKDENLNKENERIPVISFYHKLINSRSETDFLGIVRKLEEGTINEGAMKEDKIRHYFLENIIPKIRDYDGR